LDSTKPILHLQNLGKSYHEMGGGLQHRVLKGINLVVTRSEFIAVMGASGSGKTTLLNLIGGLDVPDSGCLEIDGLSPASLDDEERSAMRLRDFGFVFQFFNLLPHLTVRENISLPAQLLERDAARIDQDVRQIAVEVGIAHKLDQRIQNLSGGEMQRVALARALVHDPRVLLADEPTGNLDSTSSRQVLDLIKRLRSERNLTVVIATHDRDAAGYADRIIHIRDGMIKNNQE
jgi:putative ABC transport system ATP-binding protein